MNTTNHPTRKPFGDVMSVWPKLYTADGMGPIKRGDTVFIRFGGAYPKPGTWRIAKCKVLNVEPRSANETTEFRLQYLHGDTQCWRSPAAIYFDPEIARGIKQLSDGVSVPQGE
jgi:hypothetical protein